MSSFSGLTAADLVPVLRAAGCVFAEDEAALLLDAAADRDQLSTLVQRRVDGEPLEYILGWAEFHGLRIAVEPGVFVPRRRTEFLVDQAFDVLAAADASGDSTDPVVVLDLCCGTGAIGIALAAALGGIELHATDVDPAAVRCAQRNIGEAGRTYQGDLFDPLPVELRGRVDLLAANVPYVPTAAIALMPPEARLHEAQTALDGGSDGLAVLRRVAAAANGWLRPGGHLIVETSERQASTAAEIVSLHGLTARVLRSAAQSATVVIGTRPVPAPTPG